MEISVLEKLIPLLAGCGVSSFKDRDLVIEFRYSGYPVKELAPSSLDSLPLVAPLDTGVEPPSSLKTPPLPQEAEPKAPLIIDEVMGFDKILFHSAEGDPSPELGQS